MVMPSTKYSLVTFVFHEHRTKYTGSEEEAAFCNRNDRLFIVRPAAQTYFQNDDFGTKKALIHLVGIAKF